MPEQIRIRRTDATDLSQAAWVAVIDLTGTYAEAFVSNSGPANEPRCEVKAFGNSPEHALSECYLRVGKQAALQIVGAV